MCIYSHLSRKPLKRFAQHLLLITIHTNQPHGQNVNQNQPNTNCEKGKYIICIEAKRTNKAVDHRQNRSAE